jgi:hypothetical protein
VGNLREAKRRGQQGHTRVSGKRQVPPESGGGGREYEIGLTGDDDSSSVSVLTSSVKDFLGLSFSAMI